LFSVRGTGLVANRMQVVAAFAIACLFAVAFAGSVRADDGDTFPPGPEVATDPSFTKHVTTFDELQPPVPLDENVQPPGGYIPSLPIKCTSPGTGIFDPQWRLVAYPNDDPVTLEGQVTSSKLAWDDNQADHHSRDRNFFVFPDLAYAHLLSFGNFHIGEPNEIGRMEVEWESAAFPAWALPMPGDRVHLEGSHIWDCAHGVNGEYRTEIHPPRLLMVLRDAANEQWSNGSATIPPRPGWADRMPGLGSVPVPVTRADVFGSSDGGEAREQLTCFHPAALPPPPGCPPDWYQELRAKKYDLFVPAPPKPDPDAQLMMKLVPRPFLNCDSDDGNCGDALDELASHPERFTFTEQNGLFEQGVAIHIDLTGPEPNSLLYGFAFTLEVGWNRPAVTLPQRLKVTVLGVHIDWLLDGPALCCSPGDQEDGEYEISAMVGDTFRHLRLTGGPKAPSYDSHQDVPDTEDLNVGDYGIKTTGDCGLDAPSGADTSPCQNSFVVTLLPGQPLRVFFRAEEHDFLSENDEAGSVERIATATQNPAFAVGTHTEWFQERTSAGDDALHEECGLPATPCLSITYKIENDPIPAPPSTTLTGGVPIVQLGGDTWVTSGSGLVLHADPPSGRPNDLLEIHSRFWRVGTQPPPETICGSGFGLANCTVHLNKQDGLEGHYTVESWGVDATTGSIEATHTEEFRVDNTAPTTSASLTGTFLRGWSSTPVTVTLSATDGAGIGVGFTTYKVDAAASATYTAPFAVSGDSASHSVVFSSQDKLSNTEADKSVSFAIDATPPTLSISNASDGTFTYTQDELVNGLFTNGLLLQINYSSFDALSGIWQVRIDGTPIGFTGTTYVALPAGISTHSLVAEDTAGNLTMLTFAVVSVTPLAVADPQGAGYWKTTPADLSALLDAVNIVSRAFGAPDNKYAEVTVANYQAYVTPGANPTPDQKVARELLVAWLNLVSGREAAAQKIDLKSVSGWWNVVKNTGGQQGSSVTTALNLVRESERRLEDATPPFDTIQTLLEKLNFGKLNK
jgi:hypothetical protein